MEQNALVIGASGGIGRALALELETRGYSVTRLSRSQDGFDINCEDSVATALGRIDTPFDLILVASGILSNGQGPEKTLRSLSAKEMSDLFTVNAIGPALILKHSIKLLHKRKRSVFAALSARVGSIGDNKLGGWFSYRTSKSALNQVLRTASIELARTHKNLVCTAVHPGTVATEFTKNYSKHQNVSPHQAAIHILNTLDNLTPEDSGHFFDWAGKPIPW
ncbi:SDR family NAD(P)-dependent oxidoreductase [Pseudophaeobacter sp.]|uniref:SDR family NAD(P)-dependent oxidoreductase n=1 Tax=Pseudophaeobacter sp. TaxID=1971739 RepID=UPI004059201D